MCGIFGVVARPGAPYGARFLRTALGVLMAESESRGKDSSGLVLRDEAAGRYRVFKGPVRLSTLTSNRAVSAGLDGAFAAFGRGERNALMVMGHSRLV